MSDYYTMVAQAADWLRQRVGEPPAVGIVLGSGLGDFADELHDSTATPYTDIPNWPPSAVVGHAGKLVVGTLEGQRVAALAGRAHFYEGHDMRTSTFGTRVLGLLGVRTLILTNAAGGIDPEFTSGTLMVIDDHLNLMGTNPLVGPNDERFGPRFPDMSAAYAPRLRELADQAARESGVKVAHGVYAAIHGPSYETPAEIRYLRTIGANAVGMSTAPETIVGRHMGMEVLGISCITNAAAGVAHSPLAHDEVMEVAQRVRADFARLLRAIIARL